MFYLKRSLPRFFTLIHKVSNPLGLDDYKSIFLIGCMHEAFSKLLAARLKKVLHSILSSRQILDDVLVANEVVNFTNKEGKSCHLFKIDFDKA